MCVCAPHTPLRDGTDCPCGEALSVPAKGRTRDGRDGRDATDPLGNLQQIVSKHEQSGSVRITDEDAAAAACVSFSATIERRSTHTALTNTKLFSGLSEAPPNWCAGSMDRPQREGSRSGISTKPRTVHDE